MAKKNLQNKFSETDNFGMDANAFGAVAKTTDSKFTLTKKAAGLDLDYSDAVKPSGASWTTAVLTLKDKNGSEPIVADISAASTTATTAVTDANAKKLKGEITAELTLTDDTGAQDTALVRFTYGDLATDQVVRSIGNEA